MMENSNTNWAAMSDKSLLSVLGDFLRETRLRQNRSQQEVATSAGISRSTLASLENGGGGALLSFVEVMRTLDQLYFFTNFQVRPQISPLQLAKLEHAKRLRASGRKKGNSKNGDDKQ
jgi:transcriptional regulator with XRE-family HTH domain